MKGFGYRGKRGVMGKKIKERVGKVEAEIRKIRDRDGGQDEDLTAICRELGEEYPGKFSRLDGLEGRVKDLELWAEASDVARRAAVCPDLGRDGNHVEVGSDEPTLWWFEGQFWVKDREKIPGDGEVALFPVGPVRCGPSCLVESMVLRPARTFSDPQGSEDYVESGEEAEHPKKGQCFIGEYSDGFRRAESDCPAGCDSPPVSVLIPESVARERCGVSISSAQAGPNWQGMYEQAKRDLDSLRWSIREVCDDARKGRLRGYGVIQRIRALVDDV